MRTIDTVYIDGQFVTPHGEELFDLFNPATEEKIAQVRLGDAIDAKAAVAAAKRAFPAYSRTSKSERIALLRRLHDAVAARTDVLARIPRGQPFPRHGPDAGGVRVQPDHRRG
jgi:aldehyde dehydrogenase (NAD+)